MIVFFQLLIICYVYKLKRFCFDCQLMTGKLPSILTIVSWKFITPLILILNLIKIINNNYSYTSIGQLYDDNDKVSIRNDSSALDNKELLNQEKKWPTWYLIVTIIFINSSLIIVVPIIKHLNIIKLGHRLGPRKYQLPIEELRDYYKLDRESKSTSRLYNFLIGSKYDNDDDYYD